MVDEGTVDAESAEKPAVDSGDVSREHKSNTEVWLDDHFEGFFFELRYAILLPVIISFIAGIIMFVIGTYHVYGAANNMIMDLTFTSKAVTLPIIKALDAFLVGIILIIFSFGVYDFFVSEMEPAQHAGLRADWIKFDTTGDLKNKLIEVVLVILAIKFFEKMVAHGNELDSFERYLVIPIGAAILAVSLGFFKWATH
jgi:uncharacterized membrane protein YqhA